VLKALEFLQFGEIGAPTTLTPIAQTQRMSTEIDEAFKPRALVNTKPTVKRADFDK
jgi:hypothetical protein